MKTGSITPAEIKKAICLVRDQRVIKEAAPPLRPDVLFTLPFHAFA